MLARILRLFSPFKGKQRLARFLLSGQIRTLKDRMVTGRYGCRYILPNIIENVGFDIYVDGVFENDTIRFISQRLSPSATWLDIGANIGSISIPVCTLRKDTHAICIEASPRVFRYLQQNCELNQRDNMVLVNRAMTDHDDKQVSFFSPEGKFGKGSLASVFTNEAESVTTISMDTLVSQQQVRAVDFLKVDVEGFEYYVFKGGEKLLGSEKAPDILFEFIDWAEKAAPGLSPGDAQRLLLSYGYTLYAFDHGGRLSAMQGAQSTGYSLIFATKKHNISK